MLQSFPTKSQQLAETTALLQQTFSVDPHVIQHIFVPYRISPLGAHVDHQGGHVLGRTIATGTMLAYAPLPEPEIHLASTNFSGTASFRIGAEVQPEQWWRYAQAAALALQQSYTLGCGFVGVSGGTLIGAGLSSSASVGLAYMKALADANAVSLTRKELVELDSQLERTYLGLNNGILDQSSILFGRDDALVYIDTRRGQTRLVADPAAASEAGWLIAFSGVARELTTGGGYNRRVVECREAAQWLQPTAELLADVPPAAFATRAADMPGVLRRRATHFFDEVVRVSAGVQAWEIGDLARFGSLMNASCASSIHQYESGHEAVIGLHQIVSAAPGVYGSRFSGGGYGGCVIGLVEQAQAETAASQIMHQYRQRYPEPAGKAAVYWQASEGV